MAAIECFILHARAPWVWQPRILRPHWEAFSASSVRLGLTTLREGNRIKATAAHPCAAGCAVPLPPRSMVGQLTLDQHIGVRIPGGQPVKSSSYLSFSADDFPGAFFIRPMSRQIRYSPPGTKFKINSSAIRARRTNRSASLNSCLHPRGPGLENACANCKRTDGSNSNHTDRTAVLMVSHLRLSVCGSVWISTL